MRKNLCGQYCFCLATDKVDSYFVYMHGGPLFIKLITETMYLEELSNKVWATKNARFLASKRMGRSRKSSTVAVALLSASIIAVNMLVFFDQNKHCSTMITVLTIILSTFSLVVSLLIAMLRYEYREDNYHQCAMDLENLNQRIKLRINEFDKSGGQGNIESPKEDNEKFLKEYYDIQKKYNQNHTDFDYKYSIWKAERNEGDAPCVSLCYWLRWNVFDVYMLYWLIALAPIAALIWACS